MEDSFPDEREEFEAEQRAEQDLENLNEALEEEDEKPESLSPKCPAYLVDYYTK